VILLLKEIDRSFKVFSVNTKAACSFVLYIPFNLALR
jgi:hypothetical protein